MLHSPNDDVYIRLSGYRRDQPNDYYRMRYGVEDSYSGLRAPFALNREEKVASSNEHGFHYTMLTWRRFTTLSVCMVMWLGKCKPRDCGYHYKHLSKTGLTSGLFGG